MKAANRAKKAKALAVRAELAPAFERFCLAVEAGAGHKAALAATGLVWREVSNNLLLDSEMADRYARALAARDKHRAEAVADEAFTRAVEGEEVPIVRGEAIIGTRKEKSDRLLELLYRAHHPEQFTTRIDASVDATTVYVQLLQHIEASIPAGGAKMLEGEGGG